MQSYACLGCNLCFGKVPPPLGGKGSPGVTSRCDFQEAATLSIQRPMYAWFAPLMV